LEQFRSLSRLQQLCAATAPKAFYPNFALTSMHHLVMRQTFPALTLLQLNYTKMKTLVCKEIWNSSQLSRIGGMCRNLCKYAPRVWGPPTQGRIRLEILGGRFQ